MSFGALTRQSGREVLTIRAEDRLTDALITPRLPGMKFTLLLTLITLFTARLIYSEGIAISGPKPAPGVKEGIDQLNADVAVWNRQCAVTRSEAEQSWCDAERARLEYRKAKLTSGGSNSSAYSAINPAVEITLRAKTGGKIVKQVTTDAQGGFKIGTVSAGAYTLEFQAKSPAKVKNQSFVIKLAGTKTRSGEKGFAGRYIAGGVALDVETLPGTPLHGVITPGLVKNAKKMIWLPQQIGGHLPGRWVEEGSAQAVASSNLGHYTIEAIRKMQDHGDR
jgi:hypothetical protein